MKKLILFMAMVTTTYTCVYGIDRSQGFNIITSTMYGTFATNEDVQNSTSPIVSLIRGATTPIWLTIASTMTTITEVTRSSFTILNNRVTILENAAPAGGAGMTTFYAMLSCGGDVFKTTNFNDIPESIIPVTVTWNITGVYAYNNIVSTGSTFYAVGKTTDNVVNVFSNIITGIVVSSNVKVSGWIDTATQIVTAGQQLSMQVIQTDAVSFPSLATIMVRYWRTE